MLKPREISEFDRCVQEFRNVVRQVYEQTKSEVIKGLYDAFSSNDPEQIFYEWIQIHTPDLATKELQPILDQAAKCGFYTTYRRTLKEKIMIALLMTQGDENSAAQLILNTQSLF